MNKRIKGICAIAVVVMVVAGCSKGQDQKEVVLVTNGETVEESGFGREIWQGMNNFSKESGVKVGNLVLEETTEEAAKKMLEQTIEEGAKVVICGGDVFEVPVYELQKAHKKVKFIFFEGMPHDEKAISTDLQANTCVVKFKTEELGFLAGYASVKEGYKNLGFIGGPKRQEVQKYGSGFIQGASYGATELGYTANTVKIHYSYVGDDKISPAHMGKATKWFEEGSEVIFHVPGKVDQSVLLAAGKHENKKVIASDFNQNQDSDYILTSAVKSVSKITSELLEKYKDKKFQGGKILSYGISEDGVLLDFDGSRFANFSKELYETFMTNIKGKNIKITQKDIALGEDKLPSDLVQVIFEE